MGFTDAELYRDLSVDAVWDVAQKDLEAFHSYLSLRVGGDLAQQIAALLHLHRNDEQTFTRLWEDTLGALWESHAPQGSRREPTNPLPPLEDAPPQQNQEAVKESVLSRLTKALGTGAGATGAFAKDSFSSWRAGAPERKAQRAESKAARRAAKSEERAFAQRMKQLRKRELLTAAQSMNSEDFATHAAELGIEKELAGQLHTLKDQDARFAAKHRNLLASIEKDTEGNQWQQVRRVQKKSGYAESSPPGTVRKVAGALPSGVGTIAAGATKTLRGTGQGLSWAKANTPAALATLILIVALALHVGMVLS